MTEKRELYERGLRLIETWCNANAVDLPTVVSYPYPGDNRRDDPGAFGTCAYYRDGVISINVARCAGIGRAGRQWSYPGYVVDRTPYGVLAHELGHHVDHAHGPAGGERARKWLAETGERPITGYADNENEIFAEMFRLYVTNPALLRAIRPKMGQRFFEAWPHPAVGPLAASWELPLVDSARHMNAARNKVKGVRR